MVPDISPGEETEKTLGDPVEEWKRDPIEGIWRPILSYLYFRVKGGE